MSIDVVEKNARLHELYGRPADAVSFEEKVDALREVAGWVPEMLSEIIALRTQLLKAEQRQGGTNADPD